MRKLMSEENKTTLTEERVREIIREEIEKLNTNSKKLTPELQMIRSINPEKHEGS